MMILKYNNFIVEKLGIHEELEKIGKEIYNSLTERKYSKLELDYNGVKITIDCFKLDSLYSDADFEVIGNNHFKLRIKNLSLHSIVHELKHLDRYIRRKNSKKIDDYEYLTKMNKYIVNYIFLFKNKKYANQLINILYFSNQEEFEAHFNHIYIELKETISPITDNNKRRELIEYYLKEEPLYVIYSNFYISKFDISKFFKSDDDMMIFIEKFYNELHYSKRDLSILSIVKSKIKSLFGIKSDYKYNKTIENINNLVNNNIKRNYKKIYRLYTLLL